MPLHPSQPSNGETTNATSAARGNLSNRRSLTRNRRRTAFAGCVMGAAALVPLTANAFRGFDAGKADASLFDEESQVVMVRNGHRRVLSMLNDYSGPLSEFTLIVPTPTVLTEGQVRVAEKTTFERLDAYSSPRLAQYHDTDPCQMNFNWGQQLYPRLLGAPSAAGAMRFEAKMMKE